MPDKGVNRVHPIQVRDTEILATDARQTYREKIARITLDSMVQFVGLLDADGTVLEINRIALDAVGVTLPEVEGKPFWTTFWWQVSEDINAGLRDGIARAAQGEFVRWDTPIYGRAGGKETIIIDASLNPVFDARGQVVFICAEGRDITEKKMHEREIAQKNIELHGLLQRIRELDEVKTQFFANVSHELRTPLALIIGPAERLANSPAEINTEQQKDTARVIARNAKMLLKHVNDLLDISKLEAKKLKIELAPVNMAELVRLVASHFEILAEDRGIDFRVETSASLIAALDADKMQRIIMNLLSNAFKFVPNDGIVRCALELQEDDAVLTVEDTGPGVQPELRKVIFDRFRQGDGATNRLRGGTGLGLAIAHEFVEMHKGSISVGESGLGGALFRVMMPMSADDSLVEMSVLEPLDLDLTSLEGAIEELHDQRETDRTPQRFSITGDRDMILVVEDNPDMNKFLVQSLSPSYDVVSAFDGEEGLEKAMLFRPALIVSDIMMPRVSGVQMIEAIRARPEMKEIPILILSAKADEELKLQLLEKNAQDFITKPFNERDLLVRVQNLVAVRKSYESVREIERMKQQAVESLNRELQMRSQQLSELFESTPSFMAVGRGADHVCEFANDAFYKLVGHRQIIGIPAREAFPEIEGQGFFEMLDQVWITGQPFRGVGLPVMLQRETEGPLEQRYVDFIFQPLIESDERVSGIFIEGHDVTEEIMAKQLLIENEERLRQHSIMLEQQVAERTQALHELNQALKVSNEDLQQFAHVASHDLKEPIRKIRTYSSRLQDEYQHLLTEKGNLFLKKILSATDRVYAMINGVLDYSTVAAKEMPDELVDLNVLIGSIEVDLEVLIQDKKATIESEDLPAVTGIPVLLYQLFYNLLNNSIKFARPGIPPIIQIRHERVMLEGIPFIKIMVCDNGIGFDQVYAEKIFTTFTRLHSKDAYEGTGLGLALCKKIVQRHNGFISATGEIHKGAVISILLPVDKI